MLCCGSDISVVTIPVARVARLHAPHDLVSRDVVHDHRGLRHGDTVPAWDGKHMGV